MPQSADVDRRTQAAQPLHRAQSRIVASLFTHFGTNPCAPAAGRPAAAAAAAALTALVEAAFARTRPFYSNLLDDYAPTDHFLVCGDSLVLELVCSERLDWAGGGGQFLQLRAGLEQFFEALARANSSGLRCSVVFFGERMQGSCGGAGEEAGQGLRGEACLCSCPGGKALG